MAAGDLTDSGRACRWVVDKDVGHAAAPVIARAQNFETRGDGDIERIQRRRRAILDSPVRKAAIRIFEQKVGRSRAPAEIADRDELIARRKRSQRRGPASFPPAEIFQISMAPVDAFSSSASAPMAL